MPLTDAAVAADLLLAGLKSRERVAGEIHLPLPTPPPYYSPASCRPEHGRFDSRPGEVVDIDDPDMPAKVNAGWWRMAVDHGLFDTRREFLIEVDYREPDEHDPQPAWVKVSLADDWDLAASGSNALRSAMGGLFTTRFVPEFFMLSLDHQALLNTTV